MNYGYGLGNGTGLIVTERDSEGSSTFDMDPDLYIAYLLTLQVGARDVDDQQVGDTHYTSFMHATRGLVSLTAKVATSVAALALAVTLQTASAQPTSCYPAGTTGEGFPVVQCTDGATWYQDLDGQPYENAAGYPVYAPSTWVEMTP
jgi:hypothetical protein